MLYGDEPSGGLFTAGLRGYHFIDPRTWNMPETKDNGMEFKWLCSLQIAFRNASYNKSDE